MFLPILCLFWPERHASESVKGACEYCRQVYKRFGAVEKAEWIFCYDIYMYLMWDYFFMLLFHWQKKEVWSEIINATGWMEYDKTTHFTTTKIQQLLLPLSLLLPSPLSPSFLHHSLPSFFPPFLPSFLSPSLPSFLPSILPPSILPSLLPPSFLPFIHPSSLPLSFPSSLPPSLPSTHPPSLLPFTHPSSLPPSFLPSIHPSFLSSFFHSPSLLHLFSYLPAGYVLNMDSIVSAFRLYLTSLQP